MLGLELRVLSRIECVHGLVNRMWIVEGEIIMEFADALNFAVANTWFKKEGRLITYESDASRTVIRQNLNTNYIFRTPINIFMTPIDIQDTYSIFILAISHWSIRLTQKYLKTSG